MKNEQMDSLIYSDSFLSLTILKGKNVFKLFAVLGAIFMVLGVTVMYFTPPFPKGANGFNVSGHPIFYMVSEAFMAFTLFFTAFISSVLYFWKNKPIIDTITVAAVKTGVLASLLTLLIGMIWAKVEWGYYWQWEPRETMALIMFLFYVGLLIFRSTVDELEDKAKLTAVFGIASFPTVPMTYVIVGSLHPSNVISSGSVSTFPFVGVMLIFIGTLFIYLCFLFLTIELEILSLELERKKFILMNQD